MRLKTLEIKRILFIILSALVLAGASIYLLTGDQGHACMHNIMECRKGSMR
ncbi:MAG: hypothetical protein HY887_08010 [Deltaproteobacteria bacterium]|nr:hypothetical protein [Deltaproteobacteria bacterium]